MNAPVKAAEKLPSTAAVLDALSVDSYLLEAFIVPKVLSLFRVVLQSDYEKWNHSLRGFALPLLQIATLLGTNGQTPAVRLLGLEMKATRLSVVPSSSAGQQMQYISSSTQLWRTIRLLAYAMLRFAVPVLYIKWKEWVAKRRRRLESLLVTSIHEHDPHNEQLSQELRRPLIALQRQCRVSDTIIQSIRRVVPILQLTALLSCWSGISNTPDLSMIAAGLTYRAAAAAESNAPDRPMLHVNYAQNRWLGEHVLQTAKLLLFSSWAIRDRVWSPILQSVVVDPANSLLRWLRSRVEGHPALEANETCPLCRQNPTTMAVQTNCGHLYCYTCLYYYEQRQREALPRRDGVHCKICSKLIDVATVRGNLLPIATASSRSSSSTVSPSRVYQ